ncbi:MAG: GNAT family N-acetyltransferase [Anaerolineales bacterium]|nr:GNAT family N-acetyltransferase [Anaerolineales bacterium]
MRHIATSKVAELERLNYQATAAIVQATPGVELWLRDDVIITSNATFSYPDATHACLLQADSTTVDALITEIIAYFQARALPPTIFVSPACTPADLPERLQQRGFVAQPETETWLAFENLLDAAVPPLDPKITIEAVTPATLSAFIQAMLAAFAMPDEWTPFMTQLTAPSVGLPGVFLFVAYLAGQPIGTGSLICYRNTGILGGVGVIPAYRGSKAATNLFFQASRTAQAQGVDTLLLQTTAGRLLERLLRIGGCNPMFTRTAYTLTDGQPG